MLLVLTYTQCFTRLPLVTLHQAHRGSSDIDTRAELLTYYLYATHRAALPRMIVGKCLCLSVILMVNKFHYNLSVR